MRASQRGITTPVYTRDMKELADEFIIFYTSVGVKAAEESKKIAIANNLRSALFSIYINDLPTTPIVCPLESYVDDSKIYLSFSYKDINVAEIQLTCDLRRIAAWC